MITLELSGLVLKQPWWVREVSPKLLLLMSCALCFADIDLHGIGTVPTVGVSTWC